MIDELMFADGLVSDEELEHIGRSKMNGAKVGSGRYPLGSGKNPYHHGTLSPFGKLREGRLEKKKAAAKSKQLQKARQAKIDKAEYERKKQEALKNGSAKDIAPFIKDLTYDELKSAKNRLQLETEFRDLMVKEYAAGNPKVEIALAKAEKVAGYVNKSVDAYNSFARVYNAFSSEVELPVVDTKYTKSRRDIVKGIIDKKYNRADNLRNKEEIFKKRQEESRKSKAEADAAELIADQEAEILKNIKKTKATSRAQVEDTKKKKK